MLSKNNNNLNSSTTASCSLVGNTISNISSICDITSEIAIPTTGFNRKHRKISYEEFLILLETMREDNYTEYLEAIYDIITHPGFRMLSDEYLTEFAKDIEEAEQRYYFEIEDYYNLDDFTSFKLLRKLR
jgi:hypothetical protein